MPRGVLQHWANARSGAVGVYVALAATVMFGIIGLAIDATRALIVRSESQAAADAAALAAASQLDGTSTAITRANTAIANLVTNQQRWASGGVGNVTVSGVRFLSSLPASDDSPITATFVTTDPLRARFVEVTTAPLTHQNTFLRAVGASASATIATTAVAGGRQMVCGSQPMMICNPDEASEIGAAFNISHWQGASVRLLYQHQSGGGNGHGNGNGGGNGGSGTIAPGNFGFLSPGDTATCSNAHGNGTPLLAAGLASTCGANACYGPAADMDPGLSGGAREALNVRFGIYENPFFGNEANNSLYAADQNILEMPLDNILLSDPNLRFGNGIWNCAGYWSSKHPGIASPQGCTSPTTGLTRYEVYRYEIAHGLYPQQPNSMPDRRIIRVAVINCRENNVHGNDSGVPVITYIRVFLTARVTEPQNGGIQIVGEIIDVVEPGKDDAVLHDVVQLYR